MQQNQEETIADKNGNQEGTIAEKNGNQSLESRYRSVKNYCRK